MKSRILFTLLGVALLLLVMYDMVLWIRVYIQEQKNFTEAVKEYVAIFPGFIHNALQITIINLIAAGLSIFFFIMAKKDSKMGLYKKSIYVLVTISGVLGFWNLFSLM